MYRYDFSPLVDATTLDLDTRINAMLYGVVACVPGYDMTVFNLTRSNGQRRRGTSTRRYYLHYAGIETKTITGYTDVDAIERANSWIALMAIAPIIEED